MSDANEDQVASYSDWRESQNDDTSSVATWGPDRTAYRDETRPTIATLNSVVNDPVLGDQRQFVRIRDHTDGGRWTRLIKLQRGHQYQVEALVINNSNLAVKYPTASVIAPSVIKQGEPGRIRVTLAGAASPGSVYDAAQIRTESGSFAMRYVPGSAVIDYSGESQPLNIESFFKDGADISTAKQGDDPILPPNSSGVVRFALQADQPQFLVETNTRQLGSDRWRDSINVNSGELVELKVTYTNSGSTEQNNVNIRVVGRGVSVLAGSVRLYNTSNPSGLPIRSNADMARGINIGGYAPGGNAVLLLKLRVDAPKCSTVEVSGTAITSGGSKADSLPIVVQGESCS